MQISTKCSSALNTDHINMGAIIKGRLSHKNYVFKCSLKVANDVICLILDGKEFNSTGAAYEKVPPPRVGRNETGGGTNKSLLLDLRL